MKKTFLISILLSVAVFSFAGKKKKDLHEEVEFYKTAFLECLSKKNLSFDTIHVEHIETSNKKPKQAVKLRKRELKAEIKLYNLKRKKEKQQGKQKTKRNFVFQLFDTIKKGINTVKWVSIAKGTGVVALVGGFFEKYKPFTKVFSLFSRSE